MKNWVVDKIKALIGDKKDVAHSESKMREEILFPERVHHVDVIRGYIFHLHRKYPDQTIRIKNEHGVFIDVHIPDDNPALEVTDPQSNVSALIAPIAIRNLSLPYLTNVEITTSDFEVQSLVTNDGHLRNTDSPELVFYMRMFRDAAIEWYLSERQFPKHGRAEPTHRVRQFKI